MERIGRLQLKAAHLDDVERVRRRVGHLGAQRRADVAADNGLETSRGEHAPGERRGRGLSFRPRNRHDAPRQPARGQLDFTNDRNAGRACGGHLRLGQRHTGTHDDQIGRVEDFCRMCTELEGDACLAQPRLVLRAIERGPKIGQRDARAAAGDEQRRGNAAAGAADNGDLLAVHREWTCRAAVCFLLFALLHVP